MIGTLVFIYGLLLGSFYNVVIYRLPQELPVHKGRSYCPTCGTKLRAVDLVPVLSFAYLGGKCRYCKTKISYRYPMIELATGILFVLAYQNFGLGYEGLLYISFWSMLLIVTMIDFDHMVIMDHVVIFFTAVHLLLLYLIGFSWKSTLFGAVAGAGLYGLIYVVSKWVYKKEAFGTGDVVLMGAIGVVFGPQKALVTGMMAFYVALFGILVIKFLKKDVSRETEIPFGPYVCVAAFIMSLYGNQIMGYLLGILGF